MTKLKQDKPLRAAALAVVILLLVIALTLLIKLGLPVLMSGGTNAVIVGALAIIAFIVSVFGFIIYLITPAHSYPETPTETKNDEQN